MQTQAYTHKREIGGKKQAKVFDIKEKKMNSCEYFVQSALHSCNTPPQHYISASQAHIVGGIICCFEVDVEHVFTTFPS